jgi:hypothetical protein
MVISRYFQGMDRGNKENHGTSPKVADVLAEIRTEHVTNTDLLFGTFILVFTPCTLVSVNISKK